MISDIYKRLLENRISEIQRLQGDLQTEQDALMQEYYEMKPSPAILPVNADIHVATPVKVKRIYRKRKAKKIATIKHKRIKLIRKRKIKRVKHRTTEAKLVAAKPTKQTRTPIGEWRSLAIQWLNRNQPATRSEIMKGLKMTASRMFDKAVRPLVIDTKDGFVLSAHPIGSGIDSGQVSEVRTHEQLEPSESSER